MPVPYKRCEVASSILPFPVLSEGPLE